MKINMCYKLVCTLYDKKEHDLKVKKVHKTIAFCQEAWLKPYIDMNTELRKKKKKRL